VTGLPWLALTRSVPVAFKGSDIVAELVMSDVLGNLETISGWGNVSCPESSKVLFRQA
jgi:hypothetical protein